MSHADNWLGNVPLEERRRGNYCRLQFVIFRFDMKGHVLTVGLLKFENEQLILKRLFKKHKQILIFV